MNAPDVSVLVVTCARPVELQRCLAALRAHLREPGAPTAEVLTVHAPGDTAVADMVAAAFPEVRVLHSPIRNLCAQRNLGLRAARGAVAVFLDDDAWPRPGWLQALSAAFASPAVLAATGPVLHGNGALQYGPMAVSPLVRPFPLAPGQSLPASASPTLPGCNLAVRRDAAFAIGGFDERLSIHFDDVDFCMRLFAHAGRRATALAFVPTAVVHHEPAPGPFRRTRWDRDWYTVARDSIWLAHLHGRALSWPRRALGALALQVPKAIRLWAWTATGRLGPLAGLRCVLRHAAGVVAGHWKVLRTRRSLPLHPEAPAANTVPGLPTRTPAPTALGTEVACATTPQR